MLRPRTVPVPRHRIVDWSRPGRVTGRRQCYTVVFRASRDAFRRDEDSRTSTPQAQRSRRPRVPLQGDRWTPPARSIGRGVLAALAVLLVVGGFFGVARLLGRQVDRACSPRRSPSTRAAVVPPPAPAQPGSAGAASAAGRQFPDRAGAARGGAGQVRRPSADAYPSTEAGRMARYRAGVALRRDGRS